ncbi:Uncharacterized protein PBTT_02715 [Plasmodiophora brassicae]|nr:hypothetical protein PBRA_006684 [Plasmodiophora brassicae]
MRVLRKCCGCACSTTSGRPQYKKHVLGVFPKNVEQAELNSAAVAPQNLSSLVHYALSYPEQLASIGRYMHKLIERDLKLGHLAKVKVAVMAMNSLVEMCHTQLAQYDEWIIRSALLLFEHDRMELRVLACECFRKVVHFQDEWSDYKKLDRFFPHLVAMCVYESDNPKLQCTVRVAGLESMSKMILFTDAQNTLDHLSVITPPILMNVRADGGNTVTDPGSHVAVLKSKGSRKGPAAQLSDDDADAPYQLAMTCLQNVGTLANLNTIDPILLPIFAYLDERAWKPPEFALACIKTVADNSTSDHGYGFAYLMLKHLDSIAMQAAVASKSANAPPGDDKGQSHRKRQIQTRIVQVTAELVLTMRLDIGPWQGLMNFLLQRLEQASGDELLVHLQDALISCVCAYCIRLPSAFDYIDLLSTIFDQLLTQPISSNADAEGQHVSRKAPDGTAAKTDLFLKCALSAAELRKLSTPDCVVSDRLISSMLSLCAPFQDLRLGDRFVEIHKILQNLSIPFQPPSVAPGAPRPATRAFGEPADTSVVAAQKLTSFLRRVVMGGAQEDVSTWVHDRFISERHHNRIYFSVHHHLVSVGSQPAHFESYFRSLVVLLRAQPHQSILATFPMVFAWLDQFRIDSASGDRVKAARVYMLVAAYLVTVSRVCIVLDARRAASELDETATPLLSERAQTASRGLSWNAEVGLVAVAEPVDGTSASGPSAIPPIDKQAVLRAVCRVPFPGLDVQKAREVLSAPFDVSSTQLDSPHRPSVSLSPGVILEHSVSVDSQDDGDSDTGAGPVVEERRASVKAQRPSHLAASTDDVQLIVDGESMESDADTSGLRSQRDDSLGTLPIAESFENHADRYQRQYRKRIASLQSINNDVVTSLDPLLQNENAAVNVLTNLARQDGKSQRWGDRALVSPLSVVPDHVPLSNRSVSSTPPALTRKTSARSSVFSLPDNPQPMLDAQQMLSDLDDDTGRPPVPPAQASSTTRLTVADADDVPPRLAPVWNRSSTPAAAPGTTEPPPNPVVSIRIPTRPANDD